ncbi:MAG: ArsA family ATPase [Rhodococcus sp.]|nr:ArsA family ATPase [Rhodococcus sp. (in: high G+C Gram-positive bacteria)]
MSSDHPAAHARLQFFVGKGGTGKTTLAAATAVAAAGGRRVKLISLDQAHSVADVLGTRDQSPTDRLDVLELDTLSLAEKRFGDLGSLLALGGNHEHGDRLHSLAPEELLGVPGVEGLLGLHEIARHAASGDYDVIVVDCPSSAEALRLLGSPAMVSDYIERLWPRHERMVAVTGTDPKLLVLVSMVERVVAGLHEIREVLCDRERTSVRLVTIPSKVAVLETRRTLAALALTQLNVDALFVNNVFPQCDSGSGSDAVNEWMTTLQAAQNDAIAGLSHAVGHLRPRTITSAASEPVGLADLGEIAGQMYAGDEDAAAVLDSSIPPIRVALESGRGLDSVYAMRMYLPVVDPSTLTLGRVEDDVVVGADGVRRRVRLVSVLRRCTVSGAELDGDDLVIRFVPDRQVWPT